MRDYRENGKFIPLEDYVAHPDRYKDKTKDNLRRLKAQEIIFMPTQVDGIFIRVPRAPINPEEDTSKRTLRIPLGAQDPKEAERIAEDVARRMGSPSVAELVGQHYLFVFNSFDPIGIYV